MRSLGKEINLNPPLVLGQLPDTPDELLKLDQVCCRFIYFSKLSVAFVFVMFGILAFSMILNCIMNCVVIDFLCSNINLSILLY